MRRFKIAALAAFAVLGLAGCTQSEVDLAHSGCIESARSQLPDGIEKLDTSGVETSNFSELAGELAGNPLGSNPEGSVLYTTAGRHLVPDWISGHKGWRAVSHHIQGRPARRPH